ncbi:MAG: hypothetical protein IID03_12465 [Candidatus Dadabacteria bacterium]|nr:hypothetical protein [Candidatus Dadabacteria bacterium]
MARKKIEVEVKDIVLIFGFIISIGSITAYAHTKFAYRDEVKELRGMVFDLWKHQGLDKKVKKK